MNRPIQSQKVPFGVDPKTVLCVFFKSGHCEKGQYLCGKEIADFWLNTAHSRQQVQVFPRQEHRTEGPKGQLV